MTKSTYILHKISITIAAMLLCACSLTDHLAPGSTQSHRHSLQAFDTLRVDAMMQVVIIPDTAQFADVICPEKLHQYVDLSTHNGNLHLNHYIGMRPISGYELLRIELHTPSLHDIWIYKPCHLSTTDTLTSRNFGLICRTPVVDANICLKSDHIYISGPWGHNGHSNLQLSGKTKHLDLHIFCADIVNSEALTSSSTNIEHWGNADLHIGPTQTLHVDNQKGTGTTYYIGHPTSISIEGDSLRVKPKR